MVAEMVEKCHVDGACDLSLVPDEGWKLCPHELLGGGQFRGDFPAFFAQLLSGAGDFDSSGGDGVGEALEFLFAAIDGIE